jgi:hypothetical protein
MTVAPGKSGSMVTDSGIGSFKLLLKRMTNLSPPKNWPNINVLISPNTSKGRDYLRFLIDDRRYLVDYQRMTSGVAKFIWNGTWQFA